MQLQAPIFPDKTKLINGSVGVLSKDDSVYYLHNGSPIFCHKKGDKNNFRYILANLIETGLCAAGELSKSLGIPHRNVNRYYKQYREKGAKSFFNKTDRRGNCYQFTDEKKQNAQELLDIGFSNVRVAKRLGLSECSIRYHIKQGNLKKKKLIHTPNPICAGSTPQDRNEEDILAGALLGIGCTRITERSLAAFHLLEKTPILFEHHQSVENAGVLFLLPFLCAQGLFEYKRHYLPLEKGYYDLDFIILLIAYMYLCRIKNPEQLKSHSVGELGKIMGSDRVPEAKCLRKKISAITQQQKAEEWNMTLAEQWVNKEETTIYYIDGHVQVYHGNKATLGKKYVSREKLCLPGMCEFWINNSDGMPYFVVTGQVNEKMQEMILEEILPQLKEKIAQKVSEEALRNDPDLPRFTLVFDREAYSPKFFKLLWNEHRVAVITYRKNVQEDWDEKCFTPYEVVVDENKVEMNLAEKTVVMEGMPMREVRKKTDTGHQTSIVTTNKKLSLLLIAYYMFARWTQENFFRYLRQDYDLDKIFQYTVEQIDGNIKVVNPQYSNLSYHLKKTREKISRRQAQLFQLAEENIRENMNKTNIQRQAKLKEEINNWQEKEQQLLAGRKLLRYRIPIKDMSEDIRYNRLHAESKYFHNIIKMICYRAETTFGQILTADYKKKDNEMRMLVKNVISAKGDIIPDYKNNTLTIVLYSLSTPRDNEAIKKVCQILNDTETIYPGTNLGITYKFATG